MEPIGPLMVEHRLIEKLVPMLEAEAGRIGKEGKADAQFIAAAVDFFRTYADRCHHGKEEDILFKELKKKDLSPEHGRILEELLAEHVYGRETVGKLLKAAEPKEIAAQLNRLVELYPRHIEKEDKHFFLPVLSYFNQKEKDAMLAKMWEFDRKLIHEKYERVVEGLKKSHG
jgi:hemerythrin-like domain-containing protein